MIISTKLCNGQMRPGRSKMSMKTIKDNAYRLYCHSWLIPWMIESGFTVMVLVLTCVITLLNKSHISICVELIPVSWVCMQLLHRMISFVGLYIELTAYSYSLVFIDAHFPTEYIMKRAVISGTLW